MVQTETTHKTMECYQSLLPQIHTVGFERINYEEGCDGQSLVSLNMLYLTCFRQGFIKSSKIFEEDSNCTIVIL